MEGDRPQFDKLLGGEEELPQDVSLMEIASARVQEIISIGEALQEPRRTGLVFQRLPRHMRRRIMSHNPKRMPRQLRVAHQRQMEKGGLPPKTKRPSRKYRRRPSNLLEAYNRRQKENVWLETHIWHAKRFHMINKWGYKLPHFPNDKSARACYRGAANHCLLQDISYYVCIELVGSFEDLINGLRMLTRKECGLSFQAKLWCKGDREGSVMLFHSDAKYPYGAIGRVSFLWMPEDEPDFKGRSETIVKCREDISDLCDCKNSGSARKSKKKDESDGSSDYNQQRKLWLWVHPSYYHEVKEELVKVFKFQLSSPDDHQEPPSKRRKSEKSKGGSKKSKQTDVVESSESTSQHRTACNQITQFVGSNVKMLLLKDMLIRLRLTGPLSHAVLRETMVVTSQGPKGESLWWGHWWEDLFKQQNQLWEGLSTITSPANVTPHMVHGLTILDPRDTVPQKRTKAVDLETVLKNEMIQGSQGVPLSPIWDAKIRDIVTNSKPSDAEVNKKRSENLVPGFPQVSDITSASLESEDLSPRLPILLVQRPGSQDPGSKRLGYGSGWDLIAPAGWGKPLWIAMVMRGARAAGLRETEALGEDAVSHKCCWPVSPDTIARQTEEKLLGHEAREKYFSLPPSKRPNYIRLGISSPFSFPWGLLCQEWSSRMESTSGIPSSDTFYVLRNLQKLEKIGNALHDLQKNKLKIHGGQLYVVGGERKTPFCLQEFAEMNGDSQDMSDCCLIPVKVTVCKKGVVEKHMVICLPEEGDVSGEGYVAQKYHLRNLEEPNNPDPYKETRAATKKAHKETLRSLRRKRLKTRKKMEEREIPTVATGEGGDSASTQPKMGPKATADICACHRKEMEKLYLPEVLYARKSCSREVAGYVTSGGFSFLEARETGYGYITLPALDQLIKTKSWNQKLFVYVRNTSSSHYCPAKIEVVTN